MSDFNTFLGLNPEKQIVADKKTFRILPAPLEATTTYLHGCVDGPEALLTASLHLENYDYETDTDITTLCNIKTDFCLTESLITAKTVEEVENAVEAIGEEVAKALTANEIPIVLGGEHTVTVGAVRALKKKNMSDVAIVQIDAHADLYAEYEGRALHHATVFHVAAQSHPVYQVGIRIVNESEKQFSSNHHNVTTLFMNQVSSENLTRLIDDIQQPNVYVSIDLDGFDPSIVPSVGTPVPGGLTSEITIPFLKCLFEKKNVVGFDVVELCPQPGSVQGDFFAATLVYNLIGMLSR